MAALALVAAAILVALRAQWPAGGLIRSGAPADAAVQSAPSPRPVPTPPGRAPAAAPAELAASPAPADAPPASPSVPTVAATAAPTPSPTRVASTPTAAPSPSPSPAAVESAACRIGDSFAPLAQALGEEVVGRCLEGEYVNLTTGDTHQRTTRGLLVWVKARGVPAFTDGAATWYRCAEAIRPRPSDQPFPC